MTSFNSFLSRILLFTSADNVDKERLPEGDENTFK